MKKYVVLTISILLFSCQAKDIFNTKAWIEQSDLGRYPNRKYIIDDLVKNYKLKGKSHREIIDLLGEPLPRELDFRRDTVLLYPIDIKSGKNGELIYTKALWVKFGNDSIVRSFEVTEWKKSVN